MSDLKEDVKVGTALCDMHYGTFEPFQLPDGAKAQFDVHNAIVLDNPTRDTEFADTFIELIECASDRPYLNKALVVMEIKPASDKLNNGQTQIICGCCYDGRRCALVTLTYK